MFITAAGVVKLGDLGLGRYFSSKTQAAHSLGKSDVSAVYVIGMWYSFSVSQFPFDLV